MYTRGDFHTHTNASDGKYPPEDLIKIAKTKEIDILAITDHDTTDNLNEALKAGERLGVKIIPGIELSTLHNEESIHILGYFNDNSFNNSEFQSFLNTMKDYREWRAQKIVENLEKYFNIKLDYEKILKEARGVIARPHIAKAIITAGYSYSNDEIFSTFLSSKSPAYVPNKKVSIEEGIKILKTYGATVILAHPVLIRKSSVDELMKFNFDGLEAIYALNKEKDTKRFKKIARKYNKLITAGSDFHTDEGNDTKHGTIGSVYLDSDNIEKLLTSL